MIRLVFTALLLFCSINVFSQGIAGYVYDSDNQPLPSVRIQIKQFPDLNTLTDVAGKYYMRIEPGVYEMVFSMIGYETQVVQVTVRTGDVVKNIWLKPENQKLDELVIRARRKDPAYEIIQYAIENREKNQRILNAYSCDVYIKAREMVETKEKQVEEKSQEDAVNEVFEENKEDGDQNNFAEVKIRLDFQVPDKAKEERTGVKTYGNTRSLFYITTTDARFSLYDNLVHIDKVTETPQISPISTTAILSYKYRLDTVYWENNEILYKIEVTPRKKGNATMSGFIWIQKGSYAITKCDLKIRDKSSFRYDEFGFTQEYVWRDSLWLLSTQSFRYGIKNRKEKREGYTIAKFSNYDLNATFTKRYFGNEMGVTTQEAYDRDSSYWDVIRPEPLSHSEQEFIRLKDSLYELENSKEYLDSVDSAFNKVTFDKVTYFGVYQRNRDKRVQWGLGSLVDMLEPFEIAGVRLGPNYYYFKKWEDQRNFWTSGHVDVGLRNGDIKGNTRWQYLYDPFKISHVGVQFAHSFQLINRYDAYLNYVKRSNYIENTFYHVYHQIEIFNGLYLLSRASLNDRKPIGKYKFGHLIDSIVVDNQPREFERYQNFKTEFTLQYVIGQQYLREPNRKMVLGSNGPTVYVFLEKGWNNVLWSDVDYEYILFGIRQAFTIGTIGTSNYHLKSGKFMRQRDLRYVDLKFHRTSDPFLYSNPLYSFQLLPESYPTKDWYFEAHYIHHFNGALINFLPLVKKLRLQLVAGAGTLFLPEYDNFNYQEAYLGVERVNKILRRRVRIGVYYIAARYTNVPFDQTFKISFDVLNERRNTWNF